MVLVQFLPVLSLPMQTVGCSVAVRADWSFVIVIPQTATYEIQDKVYVYKVVEGKAESALITVLPMNDGQNYVVISGLSVGDVIVAKGAGYVNEGQEITTKQ